MGKTTEAAGMASGQRTPGDQSQRLAALDPGRSFIVQAPAGSGKTGLLTQRFLRLLAVVENPEEVVAITFTRKAAAEMRNRISRAFARAGAARPEPPYERLTWELARHALQQSERLGWNLIENPQRLRIRTIDSLCQFIARQMPLRSGFGDTPGIEDDASALYRAAARSVANELESGSELAAALATLLEPLDNDLGKLEELIVDMLGRRDQWLPPVLFPNRRGEIERALKRVVEGHLSRLSRSFPDALGAELAALARYAAGQLGPEHPIGACGCLEGTPPASLHGLPAWNGIADLLLTQKGAWRKKVTVREGFPAGAGLAKEMKGRILQLLESLEAETELAGRLDALRKLPDPEYSDADWSLLQALFSVLTAAVAHLKLIFRDHGKADFIETALAARDALGDDLEPSDLALRIDYGLRHLLVDEFQDTSQIQNDLLRRLTAGWQSGDGRTLFLVGDPMQSIYRFRKAEVGMFLDAWQGRLGQVELEPLRLIVNFRSEQGVIDWVNERFPRLFPAAGEMVTGAVPYAPSEAHKAAGQGVAVSVHPFIGRDDAAEASLMIELIRQAGEAAPGGTTAVLVRSKAHLDPLIQRLREQRIPFQAVEIGALADRPVIMDLVSLTLAMHHPADRVSWLAVLHGPLCGMTLADLHLLTGADDGDDWATVPDLLAASTRLEHLSEDGRMRAAALWRLASSALQDRGRRSLREWIEGLWLALGGPAILPDDAAADDVEVFFRLLEKLDEGGQAPTPEKLREAVQALYAPPDPRAGEALQLMTIHKAKGLEFDTVILPGLGKSPRSDTGKLLYWLETTAENGRPELFFGPVKSVRNDRETRTSAYIRGLEKEIGRLEDVRLLYVAATRARRRLHLIGHADENKDGKLSAQSASPLARLWPAVGQEWSTAAEAGAPAFDPEPSAGPDERKTPPRWRLPGDWACPEPPPTAGAARPPAQESGEAVVYEWAGDTARAVGIVVHRCLQHIARTWPFTAEETGRLEPAIRRMLLREGVSGAQIDQACSRATEALERSLRDERGRWILSNRHADARCEVAVTAQVHGELRRLVIDRTFVDAEGVRWIIDYKTGVHLGGDLEGFLDREQDRYSAQLERYAEAFRRLEDRPLRTALYFPLVRGGWREVDAPRIS
jgi:ATP-dependent exoDNAse (exonuclease V) beta subunit